MTSPGLLLGRVLMRMTNFGYQGKVYPVNPRFKEVRGMPCFPGVRDLPVAPDHVGIVVPTERVDGNTGRMRGAWREVRHDLLGRLCWRPAQPKAAPHAGGHYARSREDRPARHGT